MSLRLVSLMFMMCVATSSFSTKLTDLHIERQEKQTTLQFVLNGQFTYTTFMLKNPYRVVIDFDKTTTNIHTQRLATKNTAIKRVRQGYHKKNTLRMVLDLNSPVKVHTQKKARQLVMTIADTNYHSLQKRTPVKQVRVQEGIASKTRLHAPVHKNSNITSPQNGVVKNVLPQQKTKDPGTSQHVPIEIKHNPLNALRDVVIVIDPGHGGKDPGAIGQKHYREKDIVLSIAKKLQRVLNHTPGIRAVLTRNGDYYIELRERLKIAREQNADVFISLHADAYINKHSHGASVYALSQTGATSEAAHWLAQKENYSELGGIDLSELDDQNGLVRTVLLDLSQTATIAASLQMGTQVLRQIDKITNLHHENVEQARFVVLKSPDIPSILIETGFITNPREEKNLSSPAYQERLTQAIFLGLKRHFRTHPPRGTHIEAMLNTKKYYVKRGDTLSRIAKDYQTSVKHIQQMNHLKTDNIHPGQPLYIPKSWS